MSATVTAPPTERERLEDRRAELLDWRANAQSEVADAKARLLAGEAADVSSPRARLATFEEELADVEARLGALDQQAEADADAERRARVIRAIAGQAERASDALDTVIVERKKLERAIRSGLERIATAKAAHAEAVREATAAADRLLAGFRAGMAKQPDVEALGAELEAAGAAVAAFTAVDRRGAWPQPLNPFRSETQRAIPDASFMMRDLEALAAGNPNDVIRMKASPFAGWELKP